MVQAGTLFGYLAAFITIVLGLALADLLVSLHRLLRIRRRLVWRPLPLLLAAFIFLSLLTNFFGIWDMTRWERIGYFGLVWQVVLSVPMFLAACAALPDEVPAGPFDLDQFYFDERRYIVSLLAIGLLLSIGDYVVTRWDRVSADPARFLSFYLPLNLLFFCAFAGIAWSRQKWVHWLAFAILFSVALVGYSGWTITGSSALGAAPALP